jgi:peptidyl-prolyl cis-trans isomerase D
MISMFRNFAKSKWAVGLLAVLALSLLITGGSQVDIFGSLGPRHVIEAGDRSQDQEEFRRAFERVRADIQTRSGQPVAFQDLVNEGLHLRYLESQTQRFGFLEWAWGAGIRPGKELVLKQIRALPAFFNQVTGQFDPDRYNQILAEQNVTSVEIEQDFRDQALLEHFGSGLFAGARVPRIYGALVAGQALESRDGRWFLVNQALAGTSPAPTDAQLTAFLEENAAQLRRPEFRMASLVLFSPDAAAVQAIPITEAQIAERFEFQKDALSEPERRTFTTLTAPSREVAQRIQTALQAGEEPAAVGRANNIRPAVYDAQPQSAIGDRPVAEAAFAMTPGQVSQPVQAGVGFTVIKLDAVTPGRAVTLDSARPQIVEELRGQAARAQTFERVEAYERARSEGKNLTTAAQEAGARIIQLPPVTAEGQLPDGQPMNAPPQVLSSIASLAKGGESDVIDAGQGQYFAVRLDDITPAALPTLADVREPLAQQWVLRENAKRLAAKAEELAGRVRAGEDIGAVAASAGATLISREGVQRSQEAVTELGQGALQGLFGQARGQVFSQPNGNEAFVVGRVDQIRAPSAAIAAPLAEQARPRVTQDMFDGLIQTAFNAAAAKVKAKNDPARALEAIGVEAAANPAGAGGGASGAPATPAAPARQ